MLSEVPMQDSGQGRSIPPIPSFQITCEKCHSSITLDNQEIHSQCSYCGYHLRSGGDTLFAHFFFVLQHRFCTWRRRCAHKEFWSFEFIEHLLWFAQIIIGLHIFASNFFGNSISVEPVQAICFTAVVSLLTYCIFIGIPQFSFIVRRLHNVNCSAVTVVLYFVILCQMG